MLFDRINGALDSSKEEIIELTCRIIVKADDVRVKAVKFDDKTNKWSELDVTDFLPIEEAVRIQQMVETDRFKALRKVARRAGLR